MYEGSVVCVLINMCVCVDEEVKAVQIIHSALEADPLSYNLLLVQCDFLRSKVGGEYSMNTDYIFKKTLSIHSG